ncbi:dUTP diphosphatase [Corynebacterium timonense]|uniref:Deoxyuridine 5'-triphosphate nucleotidohydrolase n=1 Tax=Corynebacterium timonense TaxID=441500 RepID=A0A1H1LR47_9CORY|nr:dUTP diphosphatase [Corynebacterium timonense]SDR77058.1 dUTP pyrophosphatase [Corynebacterium timonense]
MNINCQLLSPHAKSPARQHDGDAGADLSAVGDTIIRPGERALVGTGLAIHIPYGFVGLIHPRSGLAAKHGVTVLNSPGTIDHGYTGEVKVLLHNTGRENVIITQGDRIAQLVVQAVELPTFTTVATTPATARGAAGFGSTGAA